MKLLYGIGTSLMVLNERHTFCIRHKNHFRCLLTSLRQKKNILDRLNTHIRMTENAVN